MHFNFKGHFIIIALLAIYLIYKFAIPYARHFFLHQETKDVYEQLNESSLPWTVYGESEQGRSIYLMELGNGPDTTVIFGAFHGDEQVGFHLVQRLADSLCTNPDRIKNKVVLVPVVNPDGLMDRRRTNANKVDINRNFPTEDWTPIYKKKRYHPGPEAGSEKETQLVMRLINEYNPDRIISIHDPLKMNNYNGPARRLAEMMQSYNKYPIEADVGYATPGSFGTYAGNERGIPVITLELPDISVEKAWRQNHSALIRAINFSPDK